MFASLPEPLSWNWQPTLQCLPGLIEAPKFSNLIFLGTTVTHPKEFQGNLYGVGLNNGPGADIIAMRVVMIDKDKALTPYLFNFHWSSMDKVLETLAVLLKYGR